MATTEQAEAVVEKVIEELGSAIGTVTMALGVRAGLWTAMAGAGPLTPDELAHRTGTAQAQVREWLKTQAAAGYVRYADGRFELPDEVAAALVHGPGGALLEACVSMVVATGTRFDAFEEAFRTGRGFGWHERDARHWHGVDVLTRATVAPEFLAAAIEELDAVADALRSGGSVLDVGCGYGAPNSASRRQAVGERRCRRLANPGLGTPSPAEDVGLAANANPSAVPERRGGTEERTATGELLYRVYHYDVTYPGRFDVGPFLDGGNRDRFAHGGEDAQHRLVDAFEALLVLGPHGAPVAPRGSTGRAAQPALPRARHRALRRTVAGRAGVGTVLPRGARPDPAACSST